MDEQQTFTVQRCPVCDGRGLVPTGFYTRLGLANGTVDEQCRTCKGVGALKVYMLVPMGGEAA